MSEDPADQTMMAELAKLWEDDHDVPGLSTCCGPAALTTCHGGRTAGQLHPLDSQRERAGASGDTSISDPFILPGDEQTWDQDEWFLDPATLMAAPRETMQAQNHPCCQALKRRKLPPEILPALGHSTDSSADAMSSMPGTSSQHAVTHAGSPAPALNCCSFQMPHMHMPSGLVTTGQGLCNPFNMGQGMAPAMQHPHASMLPGIASGIWPQPGTNSHPQAMISASQPNILAALQQQLALPELQAASAALLASQCPKPGHPHSGLDAAVVPSHAISPTAMGPTRASGLPPRSSQPQLSMSKHATKAPSPGRPAAANAAPGESDAGSDSDGEGAACFGAVGTTAMSGITASTSGSVAAVAGAAVGRGRGVVLQPATYTGSLEDVVTLSDQCPDDAARMMCQVAGCGKDLSGFKEYHQRYRICDVHIKLPQVLKDGRLQRFCQQCGRFHDLAAFDANRKSCREQLNKHNARRRRRAQIEAQKSKAMEQLSGATGLATALTVGGTGGGGGGNGNNNCGSDIPADAAGINTAVAAAAAAGDGTHDVGRLLSALMQNPTHLHALRLLLGVQTHPALPPMQPFVPDIPSALVPSGVDPSSVDAAGAGAAASPASAPSDPPSYQLARDVVDCKGPWSASFESDHRGLRVSMKLFNRTPADLPPDLRQQVTGWLASMPTALAGAIRPGCVYLTLHLLLSRTAYAHTIKRGLSSLLNHLRTRTGCSLWHEGAYVVQMGWEMALVAGGKVTAYYHDPSGPAPAQPVALEAVTPSSHAEMALGAPPRPPRQYPMVSDVAPLCVCAPKPSGSAVLKVALRGTSLSAPGAELIVRQQGTQLRLPLTMASNGLSATVEIPFHRDAPEVASHATAPTCANRAMALTSCGVVWIEVARGAWMSPPRPLLILDDPALVNEVSELLKPNCRAELSVEERDALLVDLGMVLAHVSAGTGTSAGHGLAVQHHRHHHDHHNHHTMSRGVTDCFSGVDHSTVSLKARRLLLFACDMGWAGVAARVLPLATGSCDCAAEVVAAVHASSAAPAARAQQRSSGGGLSLLHRVVRSGNLALLQGVLHWGVVAGYAWRADRNGPGGITPLHLAALQEDSRILLALFDYAPPAAFMCLQAQDGTTPFHLAFQMGHFSLNQLTNLLADEKLLPSVRLSSVLAAAARSNSACGPALATNPGVGMGVTGVATTCGELITASGPQGREVDPCTKCHCRLPPLVLSIAAACAACGSRVPCLGALPAAADADGSKGAADDDVGHAVPGHDADRCAGCTTEQQRLAVAAAAVASAGVVSSLKGRKRPLSELSASALPTAGEDWGTGADTANNCAGVVAEVSGKVADSICGHHKGSVFSITALCQGCHANRVLEVM